MAIKRKARRATRRKPMSSSLKKLIKGTPRKGKPLTKKSFTAGLKKYFRKNPEELIRVFR